MSLTVSRSTSERGISTTSEVDVLGVEEGVLIEEVVEFELDMIYSFKRMV
jgi:hypothetical protein